MDKKEIMVLDSSEKERLGTHMSRVLPTLSKNEVELFCDLLRTSPSFRRGVYFNRKEKKPDKIYDAMIDIALIHPSLNGRSVGKEIIRNYDTINPEIVEKAMRAAEANLTSMFNLGMVWALFERYADDESRNDEIEKMLLRLFRCHIFMMSIPRNKIGYSVLLDATDATKKAQMKILSKMPDSPVGKELEKSFKLLRKYNKETHFSNWRVEELLREADKNHTLT